jgi:4-hydroxy-tetrahydrodipicolinate synthase
MKKDLIFRGVATALATPFDENGIDYLAFAKMIEFQLKNGVDALVVCGTTGESSTLSDSEKREIIEFAVKQTRNRVPVIAGTGGNDTKRACALSEDASKLGVEALLVVTPYYNKCTQKGLLNYYNEIASASGLPFIAYSVPARTGMKIEPETAAQLAENPLCAGFKDAGDSISDTARVASLCGERLPIYSGNDDRIIPVLSLGGKGVISVMSNLIPKEVKKLCTLFFDGNVESAAKL